MNIMPTLTICVLKQHNETGYWNLDECPDCKLTKPTHFNRCALCEIKFKDEDMAKELIRWDAECVPPPAGLGDVA